MSLPWTVSLYWPETIHTQPLMDIQQKYGSSSNRGTQYASRYVCQKGSQVESKIETTLEGSFGQSRSGVQRWLSFVPQTLRLKGTDTTYSLQASEIHSMSSSFAPLLLTHKLGRVIKLAHYSYTVSSYTFSGRLTSSFLPKERKKSRQA